MSTDSGQGKPGAAAAGTDAESGAESDDPARDLRALKTMWQRGLLDDATYTQRRAELEAQLGRRSDT